MQVLLTVLHSSVAAPSPSSCYATPRLHGQAWQGQPSPAPPLVPGHVCDGFHVLKHQSEDGSGAVLLDASSLLAIQPLRVRQHVPLRGVHFVL